MSRLVRRALVAAAMALAAGCSMAPGAWAADQLSLTIGGAPDRLIAGDVAKLPATVTNSSSVTAVDVVVGFIPGFGSSFDLPTIVPPGDVFCQEFNNVSCSIGDLAPGQSRTIVAGVGNLSTDGTVQVGVTAVAENVSGSGTVTWEGMLEPKADVKLDFSASAASVLVGSPVTIRGVVTNTKSAGVAYGAQVKFSLTGGVEIVSKPPDCTGTALNLVCPAGDIAPLASAERELTLRSSTEGAFTVLGTAVWARADTTPVDTQGQVTVSVVPPPEPTGPPPPATPAGPPKAVTAKVNSIAQGIPGAGRCVRTRRLQFALRSRGAWDPVLATIRVTGRKRALVVKKAKALNLITVTLPRKGRVTLRLEVTYDNGRRYKATRTFRRC